MTLRSTSKHSSLLLFVAELGNPTPLFPHPKSRVAKPALAA